MDASYNNNSDNSNGRGSSGSVDGTQSPEPSAGDEENALPTPTLETTSPTNNDEEIPSQPQQPATSEVDIPPLQSISNPISDEENLAPNDEENSPPPLLEATLVVESPPVSVVDDEPRVVYMATQVNSSYKKYSIITLFSLLFGGMATAMAILFVGNSTNNGNEPDTLATVPRPALSTMKELQSSAFELVPSEEIVPHPASENVAMYGDTLVVGAPRNKNGRGFALVYIKNDKGGWSQQAKLEAPDGADRDNFGRSVAIHGNTVIIGAFGDPDYGRLAGSASLFVRNGGTWMHQAKLLAPDGQASDQFGCSVGIFGDTVIIGARGEEGGGSAHLYTQKNSTWIHQAKLTAPNGTANNQFGWSVGIFGNTVIVGAPGRDNESVHLFALNEGIWTHQATLLAPDGKAGDRFGRSVRMFGDTVIVGAPYDDENGFNSGSAHVFALDNNIWTHQAKIVPPDAFADDRFGRSVDIFEDTIVVSSFRDDTNGLDSGSLHLFTRNEDAWDYHAKLLAPKTGDQFAQSLVIYNGTVVADSYSGEVYVFSSDSD